MSEILHTRDKLEMVIRFMMAGDGSFKQRLSEAFRHPKLGLRKISVPSLPAELKDDFIKLFNDIRKNESKRLKNVDKMALMDEIFFLYKKVDRYIRSKK